MFVPSPRPDRAPADHFQECQDALEPYFNAMIGRAVIAGWDEVIVTEAAIALAEKHALATFANNDVNSTMMCAPRIDPD